MDMLPKTTELFAPHLRNIQVIESLIAFVDLRVKAEQGYEKALMKSVQKVSEVQTEHPLYSKMLKSFKGLSSERVHQVRTFKEQIAKESELLQKAVTAIQVQMKSEINDVKNLQKELRGSFDKILKNKSSIEQKMRELDERFVMNELSLMNKMSKNGRKASEGILTEQQQMLTAFRGSTEGFRKGITQFSQLTLQKQHRICEFDIKIQQQFVDFLKKFNVHQISLVRNIQYDIDNMLKKTDIFNWQNSTEFKGKISLKQLERLSLEVQDIYQPFKRWIIAQEEMHVPVKDQPVDSELMEQFQNKLQTGQNVEAIFQQINANYEQYRAYLYEFVKSYRKMHQFKFEEEPFKRIVNIFKRILLASYSHSDLDALQNVIIFANSYYCPKYSLTGKKKTVLEQIKEQPFLSDINFWKFYLYYTVRQAVAGCLNHREEKEIHMKNGVYSTLLSNSHTMIDCGIEKHHNKNLIGKVAKGFGGLTQIQVSELFKVIESGYESHEKARQKNNEQRGK